MRSFDETLDLQSELKKTVMGGDWHLIETVAPAPGIENMGLDWELLRRAESSEETGTWVRFYRWDRPTVSLGKHQKVATAVCVTSCRELDIPIVHRPTGGRAVLHGDEITYAIASNSRDLFLKRGVRASYKLIASALGEGLRILGLETDLVSDKTRLRQRPGMVPPCFVTHSRFELTWRGRKIAGSAQRRLRKAFLQHGSLPLTINYPRMGRIFKTSPEVLRSTLCSLQEALGQRPSFDQTRTALEGGFREMLGVPERNRAAPRPASFEGGV